MYVRQPGVHKIFGYYSGYVIDDETGFIKTYRVEPDITEEENERQWEKINEAAGRVIANILAG